MIPSQRVWERRLSAMSVFLRDVLPSFMLSALSVEKAHRSWSINLLLSRQKWNNLHLANFNRFNLCTYKINHVYFWDFLMWFYCKTLSCSWCIFWNTLLQFKFCNFLKYNIREYVLNFKKWFKYFYFLLSSKITQVWNSFEEIWMQSI